MRTHVAAPQEPALSALIRHWITLCAALLTIPLRRPSRHRQNDSGRGGSHCTVCNFANLAPQSVVTVASRDYCTKVLAGSPRTRYTVLLKKIDGLLVRFLIVASAESRRDLLALSLGACSLRIPRSGPAAMVQTRNPSIFLRRTVGGFWRPITWRCMIR
ncbi:hypothetical protein Y032_0291g1575 [Ancylostoma ceylanicum]|nr:hypothetical protein Y032_0291g1575 [Ancylostoma ceylanicum]